MEMNSKNLISVKIVDRSNKCLVLGCKRRLTKRETLKAECQARLEKMYDIDFIKPASEQPVDTVIKQASVGLIHKQQFEMYDILIYLI